MSSPPAKAAPPLQVCFAAALVEKQRRLLSGQLVQPGREDPVPAADEIRQAAAALKAEG